MRKTTLVLLSVLCMGFIASGQEAIADLMSGPRNVWPLPYPPEGTKNKAHFFAGPTKGFSIPFQLWNGKLNIDLWKDFRLTEPWKNICAKQTRGDVILYRKFKSLEGEYYTGLLHTSCEGNTKEILVTVDKGGGLIDQLEVEYSAYFIFDTNNKWVTVKEFELYDRDSVPGRSGGAPYRFCIKVAHLKPDENMYFSYPHDPKQKQKDVGDIPATLHVDYYCIDPTGHFILWQRVPLKYRYVREARHEEILDFAFNYGVTFR